MFSSQNIEVLVNNFASKKIISVEMTHKVWGFFGNLKELFFFSYLCILSVTLQQAHMLYVK